MNIDWQALQEIYEKCGQCSVGFSLTYEEGGDEFYFEIRSTSLAECFVGKNRSFETARASAVAHLDRLVAQ